jgi:predicted Zn-ribbon and HTH transcriptional regulator
VNIKTPVRIDASRDGVWGVILDADGICLGDISVDEAFEIGRRVNEYDDLIAQLDALVKACEKAKSALYHEPADCWATGPSTGDPVQDLLICPGCQAIAAIDTALALVKKEE